MKTIDKRRWFVAFLIALILLLPSLFKWVWTGDFGVFVFFLNFPSILFMGIRCLPPEGYPGKNIPMALILVWPLQAIVWYYFITFLMYLKRKLFGR